MKPEIKLLLSASVPSDDRRETYRKIPRAQIQIEEAVIALARNVFSAGGQLVFGGHPSIAPLVAMVATEYEIDKEIENTHRNERASRRVVVYQSRAYEDVLPSETSTLFNLGSTEIVWTEAVGNERYNPDVKDLPQCLESLKFMREQMITERLDAMVCIGGMEGVEREFELFAKNNPRKPIYLLSSTGGSSLNLASERTDSPNIKVIDREFSVASDRSKEEWDKPVIIPYTYITALIVKEVSERKTG